MVEDKKIIFISGYKISERNSNGFTLIADLFLKKDPQSGYLKTSQAWRRDTDFKHDIVVLVPFLMSQYLAEAKASVFPWRGRRNVDVLVLDSDPYTVVLMRKIQRKFRYKKLIYRQSDPLGLVSPNTEIARQEQYLIEQSDEIWVPNSTMLTKLPKRLQQKTHVIANSIKVPSSNAAAIEAPTMDYLYHYGKFPLDTKLLELLAERGTMPVLLSGTFENVILGGLVSCTGFISFEKVTAYLAQSKALLIPYRHVGPLNDMLEVTSKILLATKLKKPVIAINVSPRLQQYGVHVANSREEFISLAARACVLPPPNIDIEGYSEAYILKKVEERIKCLQKL